MYLSTPALKTVSSILVTFALVAKVEGLSVAMPQAKAAPAFESALRDIRGKVQVPILLPSKLPDAISVPDIKLAYGEVRENGYAISLYYSEPGTDATFAASFMGSTDVEKSIPGTTRAVLANGIAAMFRPVSCGGSCAPANLWWQQGGMTYQIQIKLRSTLSRSEQEKILVATANAMVPAM
jgi:hypothetical protein